MPESNFQFDDHDFEARVIQILFLVLGGPRPPTHITSLTLNDLSLTIRSSREQLYIR